MLVKNISKRKFMHAVINEKGEQEIITLNPEETKKIADDIANIWLKTKEVIKVDDGSKDEEIKKLKEENEKLKGENKEYLIQKCKNYGIKIGNPRTAKVETLEKKIAEYETTHVVAI